jgi:glucosylceramidase
MDKNGFLYLAFVAVAMASCTSSQPAAELVTTTEQSYWEVQAPVAATSGKEVAGNQETLVVDLTKTEQTIDGFGSCFSELGWTSLSQLSEEDRESILNELYAPGVGANFNICRMPVAANDFAVDWYSYDETEGDFEMNDFSIDHDRNTLIPFIKAAKRYQPALRIWASPWSPPQWMKYNKHYASRSTAAMARRMAQMGGTSTYMTRRVDNGLPEERQGFEGTDMFIQEDDYMKAYALYFAKFIDAYRAEGIDIYGVMPQNEFNSAQIFPSCCWTAAGLARFIGQHLGPAMKAKGVEVMFGTMERPNEALVDTSLTDPQAGQYITGVAFQWAGKDALPGIHRRYPDLKMYQSEQECGDGKNEWKGATHSWDLMKHYFNNGVSIYEYWNTSLMDGGISRWGWAQNSLVVVREDGTFFYTPEYYILKHASHYVVPGAKLINIDGQYDDAIVFLNPDNSVVALLGNASAEAKTVSVKIGERVYSPVLKPQSVSTLIIKQ